MLGEHEQSVRGWYLPVFYERHLRELERRRRIPRHFAIHGVRHGLQRRSLINLRFSRWVALIDCFVDAFAWRRSHCRRYAFDSALIAFFQQLAFTSMLAVPRMPAQYAVSMGRLMFLNMAIPAPEVSKPVYHDSTYQTELFGVKRGMDLTRMRCSRNSRKRHTAAAKAGGRRKLLQDTTEEWNTIPVQDELAIIDAAVGVYDEEGWDYFVEVAFWASVFCTLAIFAHVTGVIVCLRKFWVIPAFMTIPAIELLALLIVGPGVTRALMVVMVNQTGAGYAVGLCGMLFAFFAIVCPLAYIIFRATPPHPKSIRERGDWWGFSAAHARLEVEHWSIQIVGRTLKARRLGTRRFRRIGTHMPSSWRTRSCSSLLLFTACTQKMQRRRIKPRCCSASTSCTWRTSRLFDHIPCSYKTSPGSLSSSVS